MVHFNPKRIFPYHLPNTKLDKKIKGIETSIETTFLNLFLKLDEDIKIMKCLDVGATACVIFLTEEEDELAGYKKKKKFLYCSFLGDVHCIVISKTKARKLTKNHNIEDKDERKRIENIGGVIYDEKIYGQENLTRAFGMFNLKQYGISCIPETVKISLNPLDKFIIIGTKGIFQSLTDGDIHSICNNSESTETIIQNIIQNCINRFRRENLGIIAIKL